MGLTISFETSNSKITTINLEGILAIGDHKQKKLRKIVAMSRQKSFTSELKTIQTSPPLTH